MFFDGEDVTSLQPHEIARRGVARTFQMLRIFSQMTVLENLLVGHHCHTHYGTASAIVGTRRVWQEERRVRAEMMDLLSFIGLADYARNARRARCRAASGGCWRSAARWRCGRSS